MSTEYWAKACACDSPSSTHQIRAVLVPVEEHGMPNVRIMRHTYYPQPSCDKCGVPWKQGPAK